MSLTRNIKMDNYKGILILFVVLGHLLFSYNYYNHDGVLMIVKFIYSFHMPLFMIISGYYSKNISKRSIFNFFLLFVFLEISYFLYDYRFFGSINVFVVRYSAWYLLALIIYRFMFIHEKIKIFFLNHKITIFVISSFIVFLLLFFVGNGTINKIIGYFPYFLYGYLLEEKTLKIKRRWSFHKFLICISILVFLVLLPIPFNFYLSCDYKNILGGIFRIIYFIINIKLFLYLYDIISDNRISFLTMIGRNSLVIYVMHRVFTLIITDYFIFSKYFILITIISTFMLCIVLGNSFVRTIFDKLLDLLYTMSINYKCIFSFCLILIISIGLYLQFRDEINYNLSKTRFMNYDTLSEIDNSISIGFVGDLILLESQVKKSFDGNKYDFDYMFNNMSSYFNSVDYMVGVLEGPVDDKQEYSIGDFDDGKELRLNYPSPFLDSIKNSGIDLVTLANNHLLDKGIAGVHNTIHNLENISLDYMGSYLNKRSNDRSKIVNIEGLRIGILTYNYGLNYYDEDEVFNKYFDFSNYLCGSNSKYFIETREMVKADFDYLRKQGVNYIIVLPHYGTQFFTKPDNYQRLWNNIFIDNGADVILGAHTHSVQPIEYRGKSAIINSVGNYVNSYVGYDGDISMMTKVYLNKKERKVSAISVIPILALPDTRGRYYGTSVHDLYFDNQYSEVKEKYLSRIEYANKHVGKISMNTKVDFNKNEQEFYYVPNYGYMQYNNHVLNLTEEDKNSFVYRKLESSNNVCFIGDSITEGTLNGFKPWYLELINLFNTDKKIYNFSKGGYTTDNIIDKYSDDIINSDCDLFIVNIGTNDIRYYKYSAERYKNNIQKILKLIGFSDVILLSPWQTTDIDVNLRMDRDIKKALYPEYNEVLEDFALDLDNVYYVDTNKYIKSVISSNDESIYLLDGVHPNDTYGIKLYSCSILRG